MPAWLTRAAQTIIAVAERTEVNSRLSRRPLSRAKKHSPTARRVRREYLISVPGKRCYAPSNTTRVFTEVADINGKGQPDLAEVAGTSRGAGVSSCFAQCGQQ